MKIPIVVVDDQETDRYLVKRNLARADDFDVPVELPSGDLFLDRFFSRDPGDHSDEPVLLVLMDINMPGLDGFETIEEAQRRIAQGQGPQSVAVMMFTSSDNAQDRQRAEDLDIVKGYITKPISKENISYIRSLYKSIDEDE